MWPRREMLATTTAGRGSRVLLSPLRATRLGQSAIKGGKVRVQLMYKPTRSVKITCSTHTPGGCSLNFAQPAAGRSFSDMPWRVPGFRLEAWAAGAGATWKLLPGGTQKCSKSLGSLGICGVRRSLDLSSGRAFPAQRPMKTTPGGRRGRQHARSGWLRAC